MPRAAANYPTTTTVNLGVVQLSHRDDNDSVGLDTSYRFEGRGSDFHKDTSKTNLRKKQSNQKNIELYYKADGKTSQAPSFKQTNSQKAGVLSYGNTTGFLPNINKQQSVQTANLGGSVTNIKDVLSISDVGLKTSQK